MRYTISPPPMNPVSRAIAAISAAVILAAAVFFGLAVLIVLVLAFTLIALVFYLRARWLGRKSINPAAPTSGVETEGNIIDAEYTVVSKRRN